MTWTLPSLSSALFQAGFRRRSRTLQQMAVQHDCTASDHAKNVAVIGAGAAGLVAARELQKERHKVTVFEQSDRCGGVWVYTDETEHEDLTGQSGSRRRVHSSMYSSLRTNLPRHIMAYTDLPFTLNATSSDDDRLYCSHQEVLRYLDKFDETFHISNLTRFSTRVEEVSPLSRPTTNGSVAPSDQGWPGWQMRVKDLTKGTEQTEQFDAIVVCNGHYSDPRVPSIPGAAEFPGQQLHTHNFRTNYEFRAKTVVIMGASASGQDVAREIADVAKKVYFSARPMKFGSKVIEWEASDDTFGSHQNMVRRGPILQLKSDSRVLFADGWQAEHVDVIVYATGYHYTFPFLKESGVITVEDNRVEPLYQHAICSSHPSLSFIGIPWQVIPFPMMELQAKWIARLLSGKSNLPSRSEMEQHTKDFQSEREKQGVPKRYSHRLGEDQWEYNAWLIDQISGQEPSLPEWRPKMHDVGRKTIAQHPESYRDSFPDEDLVAIAEADGKAWSQTSSKSQLVC